MGFARGQAAGRPGENSRGAPRARADGEHERQNLSAKKKLILAALGEAGDLAVRELNDRIPRAAAHLRALAQTGYLEIYSRRIYRDPFGEPIAPDVAPRLTAEQETVGAAVAAALGEGFHTFLLNGVTGSGKTEVYLRAAACAMQAGRSVLVLVPEIALITQTERRFRARFGDCVAVLHSGLSEGERYDQWSRILQGEARIAIGARSAVFAPFSDIGLIIVDEEHDASYKQEGGLHYSARDLAVVRAQTERLPGAAGLRHSFAAVHLQRPDREIHRAQAYLTGSRRARCPRSGWWTCGSARTCAARGGSSAAS